MPLDNPRPRKYANDAERQKAYRSRNAIKEFRLLPETAATIESVARELDVSESQLLASMVNFALLNRNWRLEGLFGRQLPHASDRNATADGFWLDHVYDRSRGVYVVAVRDKANTLVSKSREFKTRGEFSKLRPIDFEPL